MSNKLNKVIAMLIATLLISINFMPTIAYASSEVEQDSQTTEENVSFDAKINDSYKTQANISEGANLKLNIQVKNTGYLKDAVITFNNKNYKISRVENESILEMTDDEIKLDEVIAGKSLDLEIPISFNKQNEVSQDEYSRDSKVVLNAIYVNEKGKEKEVKKELTENLAWTYEAKESASQKLIAYKKYADKTIIAFQVNDGIADNVVPVLNKSIAISIPTLNNAQPADVKVSGENTEYNVENKTLTITKTNTANSDNKFNANTADSYIVTYIYNTQSSESTITSKVNSKVTTINNDTLEYATSDEESSFDISKEVGNFANVYQAQENKINKGYMYTSAETENKTNTAFEENYTVEVVTHDLIATIKLDQTNSFFNESKNKVSVKTNKISVDANQLVDLFGEDGKLTVVADGNTLGEITKDSTELEVNTASPITITTTSPKKEGALNLKIAKEIEANANYSKNQLKTFTTLQSNYTETILKDGNEISKSDVSYVNNLEEPTSKATLEVSKDSLSTVVTNEDTVFNVVLNTADVTDTLYTNPSIKLTMPTEVTSMNIKEVKVLYDDEIVSGNVESNGNEILVKLNGTQTKYNSESIAKGTLIRIVADLTLNKLAPSVDSNVTLEYSNDRDASINKVTAPIKIVAPTAFITVNTINANGKEQTALEDDATPIKIQREIGTEQEVKVTGTIVNNLGYNADGLTIIGTIPAQGNTTVTGEDLSSNFSTTFEKGIELTGLDGASIQYSNDASVSNSTNSWQDELTSDSKSYKITLPTSFAQAQTATFTYTVKTNTNLPANLVASEAYGVYYNNNSDEGVKSNLIKSKKATITTGGEPKLELSISAKDSASGFDLKNDAYVKNQDIIEYTFTVKNTGTDATDDTNIEVSLPQGIDVIESSNTEIGRLEMNETKQVTIKAKVTRVPSDNENENNLTMIATANAFDEKENKISNASSTSQLNLKEEVGTIAIKVEQATEQELPKKDTLVQYDVTINNYMGKQLKNVTVKFPIPDGLEFVSGAENRYNVTVNKEDNTFTVTYAKLDIGKEEGFSIKLKIATDEAKKFEAYATVTADEHSTETKSNVVSFETTDLSKALEVTQYSNVKDGQEIKDKDTIDFFTELKNNLGTAQVISYDDIVSNQVNSLNRYIEINGSRKEMDYSETEITIPANSTIRIIAEMKMFTQMYNEKTTLTYQPLIYNETSKTQLDLAQQELEITSTGYVKVIEQNSDNKNNSTETKSSEELKSSFDISGQVWKDENKNGQKEESEEKFAGIELALYNPTTNEILKDENGNEIKTQTDSEGNYEFKNIPKGKYNVIAKFDTYNYEISEYRKNGIMNSENNDFVSATFNGENVATTDIIELKDSNEFNIDLGLCVKDIFDLELTQTVSKIHVINTKTNKNKTYDYEKDRAKVQLPANAIENATVLVEYKISITNKGNVAGYANEIIDYLPSDMTFNSELNTDWYKTKDGNAHNTMVSNMLINPGETKDVTLVLTRNITGENVGTARNTAEIASTYNELGLKDINAKAGNKLYGEKSSTDTIIVMSANKEILTITGITIGILAVIALAVYEIKIHIIYKTI